MRVWLEYTVLPLHHPYKRPSLLHPVAGFRKAFVLISVRDKHWNQDDTSNKPRE